MTRTANLAAGTALTAVPVAVVSPWRVSDRADPAAVALADRHYSRQKPGTPQFIPPGRCVALVSADKTAVWVTSWSKYRLDDWRGAWVNMMFRKEGDGLASEMIRHAVAHTRAAWPQVPALGMVTFIDPRQVKRTRRPGYTYVRAGFRHVGVTPKGLLVLQLLEQDMPAAAPVPGSQPTLWEAA